MGRLSTLPPSCAIAVSMTSGLCSVTSASSAVRPIGSEFEISLSSGWVSSAS